MPIRQQIVFQVIKVFTERLINQNIFCSNPGRYIISKDSPISLQNLDIRGLGTIQIVTDWPFYNHVRAIIFSKYFDANQKVRIADLLYSPIVNEETIMLSRRYYTESEYLRNTSPYVKPLNEVERWEKFNKIFDDYHTSIYLGRYSS